MSSPLAEWTAKIRACGWSWRRLAAHTGLPEQHLTGLAYGRRNKPAEEALAAALGMSRADLWPPNGREAITRVDLMDASRKARVDRLRAVGVQFKVIVKKAGVCRKTVHNWLRGNSNQWVEMAVSALEVKYGTREKPESDQPTE